MSKHVRLVMAPEKMIRCGVADELGAVCDVSNVSKWVAGRLFVGMVAAM